MEKPKADPRKFDVQEYGEKLKKTLEKLKQEQTPGQVVGKGNKIDVLKTAEADIIALFTEGFSAKQISDAISKDVFGILPKTITQIVRQQPAVKKAKKQTTTDKKQTPPAPPSPEDKNQMSLIEPKKTDEKPQTRIKDVE